VQTENATVEKSSRLVTHRSQITNQAPAGEWNFASQTFSALRTIYQAPWRGNLVLRKEKKKNTVCRGIEPGSPALIKARLLPSGENLQIPDFGRGIFPMGALAPLESSAV
jgi:hypothetical protein